MGKLVNDDLISRSALLEAFGEEPYVWDGHDREQVQERNDWEYYTSITEAAPAVDAETVIKSLPYVKEALEMAKQTVAPVVRCEKCVHQKKAWHEDKRMKEQGFFMYSCELNDDQFVSHVVNGNPGEFCCAGKRRVDNAD